MCLFFIHIQAIYTVDNVLLIMDFGQRWIFSMFYVRCRCPQLRLSTSLHRQPRPRIHRTAATYALSHVQIFIVLKQNHTRSHTHTHICAHTVRSFHVHPDSIFSALIIIWCFVMLWNSWFFHEPTTVTATTSVFIYLFWWVRQFRFRSELSR